MAVRFVNPFIQWINGNSVVGAGDKLYFYTTGTSTPKDTFSDSDLSIANTNPVVADGNGKFGDIFLSTGQYKAILKTSADVTVWTADPVGDSLVNLTVTGTFAIDGILTPSQITSDQNNYNPAGLASATTLRLSTDASRNITGMAGGSRGRIVIIRNVGSFNIVLKDESASSTAANRLALFGDVTLQPDQAATLHYDPTSSRWFPIAIPTEVTAGSGISVSGQAVSLDISFLRSYLAGLTLSAAGSTATFGIAAGVAADSTNAFMLALASAYTKSTSAWAVGSGNGALDTGAIANSTWYHVYLIKRVDTGVVDVIFSTSASAPTLPTNYTLYRRIGSMKTDGSAQWVKFSQSGDEFLWDVTVGDVSVANLGTTATLYTLTVPTGIKVNALLRSYTVNSGVTGVLVLINSPDESSVAANATVGNITFATVSTTIGQSAGMLNVRTNTSAQIRAVASAASTELKVVTFGWIDRRGRDS